MRISALLPGLALVATSLAAPARAEHKSLSTIFMQLPPAERRMVQVELSRGGFYEGRFDAAWSDGTALALFGAADFLATASRGRVSPDMSSAKGIEAFIAGLADLEYSEWLHDRATGTPGF